MNTNKNNTGKNFLQKTPAGSFNPTLPGPACKKKRIRHIAEPRICRYKDNYYWYRRGTDQPKHLGTPDFILKAVTSYRLQDFKDKICTSCPKWPHCSGKNAEYCKANVDKADIESMKELHKYLD